MAKKTRKQGPKHGLPAVSFAGCDLAQLVAANERLLSLRQEVNRELTARARKILAGEDGRHFVRMLLGRSVR